VQGGNPSGRRGPVACSRLQRYIKPLPQCRAGALAVKVAVPLAVLLLLACAAGLVAVREPRMRGFRRFRDHKVKQQGGGGSDGGSSDAGEPKVTIARVSIRHADGRGDLQPCGGVL